MRVSNLESPRSGRPVANQYVINNDGVEYFQSYQTLIAKKAGATITIGPDYNYSVTTNKYFNEWLRSFGLGYDLADIKKWLKKAEAGDTYDELPAVTLQYVEEL